MGEVVGEELREDSEYDIGDIKDGRVGEDVGEPGRLAATMEMEIGEREIWTAILLLASYSAWLKCQTDNYSDRCRLLSSMRFRLKLGFGRREIRLDVLVNKTALTK